MQPMSAFGVHGWEPRRWEETFTAACPGCLREVVWVEWTYGWGVGRTIHCDCAVDGGAR